MKDIHARHTLPGEQAHHAWTSFLLKVISTTMREQIYLDIMLFTYNKIRIYMPFQAY